MAKEIDNENRDFSLDGALLAKTRSCSNRKSYGQLSLVSILACIIHKSLETCELCMLWPSHDSSGQA